MLYAGIKVTDKKLWDVQPDSVLPEPKYLPLSPRQCRTQSINQETECTESHREEFDQKRLGDKERKTNREARR